MNARASGVYVHAEPADLDILEGRDNSRRGELIAERLTHWKALKRG